MKHHNAFNSVIRGISVLLATAALICYPSQRAFAEKQPGEPGNSSIKEMEDDSTGVTGLDIPGAGYGGLDLSNTPRTRYLGTYNPVLRRWEAILEHSTPSDPVIITEDDFNLVTFRTYKMLSLPPWGRSNHPLHSRANYGEYLWMRIDGLKSGMRYEVEVHDDYNPGDLPEPRQALSFSVNRAGVVEGVVGVVMYGPYTNLEGNRMAELYSTYSASARSFLGVKGMSAWVILKFWDDDRVGNFSLRIVESENTVPKLRKEGDQGWINQ